MPPINIRLNARSVRSLIVDLMDNVTTNLPLSLCVGSIPDIATGLFLLLPDPGNALRMKILYLALECLVKKLDFHAFSLTSLDSANWSLSII